jgi:uncharacterized repeat protein (TIGR03803 family)
VIRDPEGALYGTATMGGQTGWGTAFSLVAGRSGLSVLHAFDWPEGIVPVGGLLLDTGGNLFGTTNAGGAWNRGTIFRMGTDGSQFVLLRELAQADGQNPQAGMILDAAGNLYGTTDGGGEFGYGVVFRIGSNGTGYTVLHSFSRGDGSQPWAELLLDDAGGLYGTTYSGGQSDLGTVFALTTAGEGFRVLHHFTGGFADGARPWGGLTLGSDGALFGTTYFGGTRLGGTVFTMEPDGSGYSLLHSFGLEPGDEDGVYPVGTLVQDDFELLYGATLAGGLGRGTVFTLSTDGTAFVVLHRFAGPPGDGANPESGLLLASGTLFGTTRAGGSSNLGTIFALPVPPPGGLFFDGFESQDTSAWSGAVP